jgi:hypothetical protein
MNKTARADAKRQMASRRTRATESTTEAHELLAEIAASPRLAEWIERLEKMQRTSEEEGWWDKDLGLAVEYTLGYARMFKGRAEKR